MLKKVTILIVTFFAVTGCGPSQQEYDQARQRATTLETEVATLKAKVEILNTELDELKFGAERMLVQANAANDKKNYLDASKIINELLKRHPASPESREASALLKKVESNISAEEQRRKREEEQKLEEARLALERATRNMEKKTDEIKGITWVSHRDSPILGKYASLYFGTANGNVASYPLRLKIQYYDDDWLFVRSLTVKADDKVYELHDLDFERDNSSGSIWEWVDMPVKDHAMINHWLSAKRVVIRFNGDQYPSDFTLPQKQQNQMREVYEAWKGMGGRP